MSPTPNDSLSFDSESGLLRYAIADPEVWHLALNELRAIGEYTTDEGPNLGHHAGSERSYNELRLTIIADPVQEPRP